MSSVTRVPQTATLASTELLDGSPLELARRTGVRPLLTQSFLRFRYGDGFSHARALALQLSLAVIPLVIALVGLSASIGTSRAGEVLRRTLLELTPGASGDAVRGSLSRPPGGAGGKVALYVGLVTALLALTTAMGQVERGANRIYGVRRDHPGPVKYGRAVMLAFLAGVPALVGFLVLVAGGALATAVQRVYGSGHTTVAVLRWPVGAALMLLALSGMVARAPRRQQPTAGWLLAGSVVALLLWLGFSLLLSAYLSSSSGFGAVYGPLTGIMALLLWSQLTALALLFGMAVAAQLEAVRGGRPGAVASDPELFSAG